MQKAMGSDIMMVLDQCLPSTSELGQAEEAMRLTHLWAKRSLAARGDSPQSLFGIVQGACFPELRRESAKVLTQMPFDGFAIGGLAVGETREQREEMTELSAELLPENLPRYLMGVGTPLDILEAVHRGVDMFDCILPTKLTRKGVAFSSIWAEWISGAGFTNSPRKSSIRAARATFAPHTRALIFTIS